MKVKNDSSANEDASIVFRYRDTSNYYMVTPINNTLYIYKRTGGTLSLKAQGSIAAIVPQIWYGLRIEAKAGQISAYWNNNLVVTWTDTDTPPNYWSSGKVGFRKGNGKKVEWNNEIMQLFRYLPV